jgi:hypothetical protein
VDSRDAVGMHIFPANSTITEGCAVVIFGGGTPTGISVPWFGIFVE